MCQNMSVCKVQTIIRGRKKEKMVEMKPAKTSQYCSLSPMTDKKVLRYDPNTKRRWLLMIVSSSFNSFDEPASAVT
jgi:hypothetical protein